MKSLKFTIYSLEKMGMMQSHAFEISKDFVTESVINPDTVSFGKSGRKIAQKALDENHVLRVIYEEAEDEIIIITLYPGRRNRYEKN